MILKDTSRDFQRLCQQEPRLGALFVAAHQEAEASENYCNHEAWYGDIKPRLVKIVGWDADQGHPELQTAEAYELAYHTILDSLPDCRGRCGCR